MHPQELVDIRRLPLFRNMLEANFDALAGGARRKDHAAGTDLVRQGEPADQLHLVVAGAVELFSTWDGNSTTMAIVHPVGTFILAASIKDTPYLMSARTLEHSTVLTIPASDVRAVFRRDAEFAHSVIDELAGCYRAILRHTKSLKLRSSRQRVAAYLLKQARSAGRASHFILPTEKRLIASYLGMTPENLSRTLRSLEAAGVRVNGQHVTILDFAALEAACPADPLIDGLHEMAVPEGGRAAQIRDGLR